MWQIQSSVCVLVCVNVLMRGHARQIRVRAQFSYDPAEDASVPCLEAALAFHRGDILEIVSQDDPVWWQARLDKHSHITRVGLIPSRSHHER